jgi:hypothetical protein
MERKRFLREEFLSLTLMATLQRGAVYATEDESARKCFRSDLRHKLEKMADGYRTTVAEDARLQNIRSLATYLTEKHSGALKDGRFRIGSAQKALNLYLKYLWCIGDIPEPPHCPFDFQIIKLLDGCRQVRWTTLDDIEDYKCLVKAARRKASRLSIAQWELKAYNEA